MVNLLCKFSYENKFGRISQDQTIEVTINQDTKTYGGLIGISLKPGAVYKWTLLRADWAEFLRQCYMLTSKDRMSQQSSIHKVASQKRMHDDELMIHQVISCIQNWVNPFQADQSLCHLASGRIAPDDLVGDLLQAHERGTKALEDFARNRLDMTGKTDFHHHLSKQKLKTFASLRIQQHLQTQNQQGNYLAVCL